MTGELVVNRALPHLAMLAFAAVIVAAAALAPGQTVEPTVTPTQPDPPAATPAVESATTSPAAADASELTPASVPLSDEQFLDEWQRRCFVYFWEQTDPNTGLVADRAPADGSRRTQVASVAATGFALTSLPIAAERGWVSSDDAYQRVLTTLRFLEHHTEHVKGFYYHFVDIHTGKRVWQSEVSSIDTALLIAGVLTVGQYYQGTEVADIARRLYERVEWPWMLNGRDTLSMGWKPESGFIDAYWEHYSEHMILQLLGLGSPTHPLPPATWHHWKRAPVVDYEGMQFLSYPPLFIHQFSHAWIDFRGIRDDYADYWLNSVLATRAQRIMAIRLAQQFPHYGENLWGVTSSDSATGYTDWGGMELWSRVDGTVVPCAAAGSIPFLPTETIAAVRFMYDQYKDKAWTYYGLVDAFNPQTGWYAQDVIGIDVGITLVMIENYRSGFVWKQMSASPYIQRALEVAGFRRYEPPPGEARLTSMFPRSHEPGRRPSTSRAITVPRREAVEQQGDADRDWQPLTLKDAQLGDPNAGEHLVAARFLFTWDDQALHLKVDVEDEHVAGVAAPDQLAQWQPGQAPPTPLSVAGDQVQVYIDPQNDGLAWGDPADFQFGFSIPNQVWEWFGQRQGAQARVIPTDTGYTVEAAIPFALLNLTPEPGQKLSASVAVRSNDPQTNRPLKLNWAWQPKVQRVYLGQLELAGPAVAAEASQP